MGNAEEMGEDASDEYWQDEYGYDYDRDWNPFDHRGTWDALLFQNAKTCILAGASTSSIEVLAPNIPWSALAAAEALGRETARSDAGLRYGAAELPAALVRHLERLKEVRSCLEGCPLKVTMADLATLRGVAMRLADVDRPDRWTYSGPLEIALLLSEFWIRPASAWVAPEGDSGDLIVSLMEHLFVRYPVPGFLTHVWRFQRDDWGMFADPRTIKWVCWFILLGQGASLVRAAALFDWCVSKTLFCHLSEAPAELAPMEACMWAEVMRLGGTPTEFERLKRSGSYVWDPTIPPATVEGVNDGGYVAFWRETVLWLIQHRAELTEPMVEVILDWAVHRRTEERRGQPRFSWKGRSPAQAHQAGLEYRRQQERPACPNYLALTWEACHWDWEHKTEEVATWSIQELTSGQALFEEGMALRHCVAGYAPRCVSGYCRIFSLRLNGERQLTLEVAPDTGAIFQARGTCNRRAQRREEEVLRLWLQEIRRRRTEGQPETVLGG